MLSPIHNPAYKKAGAMHGEENILEPWEDPRCTSPSLEINDHTLDENLPPLRLAQCGRLDTLPAEILQAVPCQLDLQTLLDLQSRQQTSRGNSPLATRVQDHNGTRTPSTRSEPWSVSGLAGGLCARNSTITYAQKSSSIVITMAATLPPGLQARLLPLLYNRLAISRPPPRPRKCHLLPRTPDHSVT